MPSSEWGSLDGRLEAPSNALEQAASVIHSRQHPLLLPLLLKPLPLSGEVGALAPGEGP